MSIVFDENKRIFLLRSGNISYAMQIQTDSTFANLWYGPDIERIEDLPTLKERCERRRIGSGHHVSVFSEYGGYSPEAMGLEPALKVTFSDGTRDVYLRYVSHEISGDTLIVFLKDSAFCFEAALKYRVLEDAGIIERSTRFTNSGTLTAVLEQFESAELHLPYRDFYCLTTLTGYWGEEYRISREPIRDGQTVIQTRNVMSGPDAVPFFAVDEGNADERHGTVWFGTVLWSGTHHCIIEKDYVGNVHILAGINPFDSAITLKQGESWETPVFAFGCTESGFGAMSRCCYDYQRRHLMTPFEAERIMPVVCNAYGTYCSKINEEKILALIEPAHDVGVEAFIIDAGWAGTGEEYAKGMGDWIVNPDRFPHGLRMISDELHKRGMLFGLWMEPECCHPDSDFFRSHPDWVFGYPSRGADLTSNRYVLNFALNEVRDYITEKIEHLIETCGVDYFKIDFNRRLYETGTDTLPDDRKCEAWIRYVENLTQCYETIKRRHPNLLFENCAGGGMRVDLSMTKFSGRINRSDNQDPLDILTIHEGFSYLMLPKFAGGGCHISDVYTRHFNNRTTPMRYQAHVAMMGSLAIGKNLAEISPEEKSELKSYIDLYKQIRHIVHLGNCYRLAGASEKPYAAYEYISQDGTEGVIFQLGKNVQFMKIGENLRLDGLDEKSLYDVEMIGVRSGKALMTIGIPVLLEGDYDSRVIRFRKLEEQE